MRIAIASGKGGTGKTTVATGLASVLAKRERVAYFDCDVEEPDGHILLKPEIERTEPIMIPVPWIDEDKCTGCGECCEICHENALARLRDKVLVFPELCSGCGGCSLVCPTGAVREVPRRVGFIGEGSAGAIRFVQGNISVGETKPIPVIRALRERIPDDGLTVLDAPPGTACSVVETLRGADRVILVTEPTPFGLNDLKLAVATARALKSPVGVVINRCDIGDGRVTEYCLREGIEILSEIPNSRSVAEAYAAGILPSEAVPKYRETMTRLSERVLELAREAGRA
jgi:MinD superfamily P-loop ATPase